jgi:hypothetical protein
MPLLPIWHPLHVAFWFLTNTALFAALRIHCSLSGAKGLYLGQENVRDSREIFAALRAQS